MFKKILSVLLLVSAVTLQAQVLKGYESGLETISGSEAEKYLEFFAHDSMKGRPAGSRECLLSALYIADKFKEAGLLPLCESVRFSGDEDEDIEVTINNAGKFEGYLQKFNIQKSQLSDDCEFSISKKLGTDGEIDLDYEYKKDFYVKYDGVSNSNIKTGVVFAGYGIAEGEDGYNDYLLKDGTEINVKDKFVVIVDSYPGEGEPESKFAKNEKREYRLVKDKARQALDRGARGVIVVQSPVSGKMPYNQKYGNIFNAFTRESTTLHASRRIEFPVLYVSEKVSADIFKELSEINLDEILKDINSTYVPNPFELDGLTINSRVKIDYEVLLTQNVAGFVEGTDPKLKDEVIVFGAHYDHVGTGQYGAMDRSRKGEVHNGADDNASGTSGLIELAQAFAKNPGKRSAVFVAFGAEENGILGSRYYVYNNPLKPIEKTVAMVNLDMIGRNESDLVWIGGAFQGTEIVENVKQANELVGMELLYNVGMLGSASDQAHFLRQNVPAVFFFSGMHDDYHTPDDDIEKVDFKKVEKITKLAYLTGWQLANQEKNPEYRDLSMKEKIALVKESVERVKKYRNE